MRLRGIDNARKAEMEDINSYEQKRPTLKRRTEEGGEPGDIGDDIPEKRRPTLKRPAEQDPEQQ